MTPEEIQRAKRFASKLVSEVDVSDLADACDEYRGAYWAREDRTPDLVDNLAAPIARLRRVLALTEQQPEPVSRNEIVDMFEAEFADAPTYVVVESLLSRYTIIRKQPERSPVCECSEDGER